MSETAYVIWFVATAVGTTVILLVLVMEAMGTFSHHSGRRHSRSGRPAPRTPREAKQYWPHTSALHH